MSSNTETCMNCREPVVLERRNYLYVESGLPNVTLQNVQVSTCGACGECGVIIPRMAKIHRAIALALTKSPGRMTGEQMRFLRKHLELTGEQLGSYLHTDKTKVSKWEQGQDKIGPTTDRLMRLLVVALTDEPQSVVHAVADYLPQITDQSGANWVLHVDVETMLPSFFSARAA